MSKTYVADVHYVSVGQMQNQPFNKSTGNKEHEKYVRRPRISFFVIESVLGSLGQICFVVFFGRDTGFY